MLGNINIAADCGKEIPTRVPTVDELLRIGWKLYHEAGPGLLLCFKPFFHINTPKQLSFLGSAKV